MRLLQWSIVLALLGRCSSQSPKGREDDIDFDFIKKDYEDRHLLKVGSKGYTDINWLPGTREMLVAEKDGRVIVFPDWENDGGSRRIVAWDKAGEDVDVGSQHDCPHR